MGKLKETLDLEDIKKILIDLGSSESKKDREGNLIFQTICHSGNANKLYYYEDSQMFRCYTDCGENFDIYELIIRAKREQGHKCSFPQAVRYVSSITGKSFSQSRSRIGFGQSDEEKNRISDWDWINKFKRKDRIEVELPSYDKRVLDVFLNCPYEEWIDEGILGETQQEYGIGWYMRGEQISIPCFAEDGTLIGIRGRSTKQEDLDNGRKYVPLTIENKTYRFPTNFHLYGIHKNADVIRKLKKVVLFEGEKSVLHCSSLYPDHNFSLATYGSSLSQFQIDYLLGLGIEEVIFCYDKEFKEVGSKKEELHIQKMMKLCERLTPYVRTFVVHDEWGLLEEKMSPIDKGKKVFEQLLKGKHEVTTNE